MIKCPFLQMENENLSEFSDFRFVFKKDDIDAIMDRLTIDFSNINNLEDSTDGSTSAGTSSSGMSATRKSLRTRNNQNSSEQSMHKTKRRSIARPKKLISVESSEKDLKNFYLSVNKKLPNLKPTPLETIFEDEEASGSGHEEDVSEEESSSNNKINTFLMKKCKKLRRSLSLSDGFNINKSLQSKRKNRVKKYLGKKPKKFKKISMSNFMDYLKTLENSISETTETVVDADKMED